MEDSFCNIISHRGYHGNGINENTLEAFEKSLKFHLPIELDVYLTKDFKLVVFHDATLKRLMGIDKNIEDCTYQELLGYSFLEGDGKIPLLLEVLDLVEGKVLLLIEVKRAKSYHKTCLYLKEQLSKYEGKILIQSFDFRIVKWFLKNTKYQTGLLVSPDSSVQNYLYYKLVNSYYFVTHFISPDFVSYDIRGIPSSFIEKFHRRKIPVYLWTIRSKTELEKARKYGDFIIAEELDSFHLHF